MKRTNVTLKHRLVLVRLTIRPLTPSQLEQVNGGDSELITLLCPTKTCWNCCEYTDAS
jgi:hypothetical protein